MHFFSTDTKTTLEAKGIAQFIAFGPVIFQVSRALRNSGILKEIEESGVDGLTIEEIIEKVKLPNYGVRVLLESGLGIGLIIINDDKYKITKTGHFIFQNAVLTWTLTYM